MARTSTPQLKSKVHPCGAAERRVTTIDDDGQEVFSRDLSFMNGPIGERHHEAKLQLKKLAGRPGIYEPTVHPRLAYLLMAHGGFSQEQLAQIFDVPLGTFLSWLHRYVAFADAILAGRDFWNTEKLEKTLYQKAVGYEYDEVEVSRVPIYRVEYDDKGKPHQLIDGYEKQETKRVTKTSLPDTASLLFVLQNRRPERWKNSRYVNVDAKTTVNHAHAHQFIGEAATPAQQVSALSTDHLLQLEAIAQKLGVLPGGTLPATVAHDVNMIDAVLDGEVLETEIV